MSSTADEVIPTSNPTGGRRTVNKRAAPAAKQPATAAEPTPADNTNADTVAAPSKKRIVKVASAEQAKPAAKKGRSSKAAAPSTDDVDEPSSAGDAAPAKATKKGAAAGGKKKASAKVDAAAEPIVTDDAADNGAASGDAQGTDDTGAAKKAAINRKRVKRDYIVAFGDLNVPAKERDDSRSAFERWLAETTHTVEIITFTDWKAMKRKFYRDIEQLGKKHKKTRKQNQHKTSENHYKRLMEMPSTEFAELHGVWLSAYGFDGAYTAEQLKEDVKDNEAILGALAVYKAALAHGYQPLGIVSEKCKKDKEKDKDAEGSMQYVTTVEGDRVYVGIGLPFRGDKTNKKSKFSVEPSDRAYFAVEKDAADATEGDE